MEMTAKKKMVAGTLTEAQRAMFWRAFSRACAALWITNDAREAYRRKVLEEETGKRHLGEIGRTGDFDRVMLRLAIDAEDFEACTHFTTGGERRIGYLIKVASIQIMQLKGADERGARDYLDAVLAKSMADYTIARDERAYFMDLPTKAALKVFQILDTHRRRLLRAFPKISQAFNPSVKYTLDGPILTRQAVPPSYYDGVPFRAI